MPAKKVFDFLPVPFPDSRRIQSNNEKFHKTITWLLVLFSSGCTAGDMITSYISTSDQSETTLQNTSGTPKQRVYMDEIKGTLKDFTGATLTMESRNRTYFLIFLKQLWNAKMA